MSGKHDLRRVGLLCALGLVLTGGWGEVRAQLREYAKVEPNVDPDASKMEFDVNIEQSDNIPPNIVLSSDARRGFTAYAGSGGVLAFSMDDGKILARIQTGGKPQFATPLPDGKTILVTSTWDNRIFRIDMDAIALTATYT